MRIFFLMLLVLSGGALRSQNTDGLVSCTFFNWANPQWTPWIHQQHTYDDQGRKNQILYQVWDAATQSWKNSFRVSMAYNTEGQMALEQSHIWSASGNSWNPSSQSHYTYTGFGKVATIVQQTWANDAWQNNTYANHEYDASGYLVLSTSSHVSLNWGDAEMRYLYTNDGNGNALELLHQQSVNDNWNDTRRETWTYTTTHKKLTYLLEQYGGASWSNTRRDFNTYDSNDYLIAQHTDNWSAVSASWVNGVQTDLQNNPNGTLDVLTNQNWVAESASWINSQRAEYVYNPLGTFAPRASFFSIAPNPTQDVVSIGLPNPAPAQVAVIGPDGRTLHTKIISAADNTLSVGNLPSGVYLIVVGQQGQTAVSKLVKD
ncbi:Por secretion system C-terminal sorting domain-containing protein [Flavobacterium caeni]|uniref:Por secretion system C-terminal sorting domain-containing protein n=2 Tax=Flavobacterium caeni TaxID=490189 RepID=A0A1G5HTU7_9FLAO|nr:Por secretion system C-terminal sorting domain-containing protein [Flavobacterium caeni]